MSKFIKCGRYATFTLLLCSCASFRDKPVHLESGDNQPALENVTISLSGWMEGDQNGESIRAELESRGVRSVSKSDKRLRISKEEQDAGSPLRFWNALATILTATIIPFYHPVQNKIEFTLLDQGAVQKTCSFETTNRELFGILLLPLSPFRWPAAEERAILKQTVDVALQKCFRSPGK